MRTQTSQYIQSLLPVGFHSSGFNHALADHGQIACCVADIQHLLQSAGEPAFAEAGFMAVAISLLNLVDSNDMPQCNVRAKWPGPCGAQVYATAALHCPALPRTAQPNCWLLLCCFFACSPCPSALSESSRSAHSPRRCGSWRLPLQRGRHKFAAAHMQKQKNPCEPSEKPLACHGQK